MSLSVRVRFEVFKRDRFTCTYCGGHPPDVLLEADHVIPRAAGGSDDMSNLVTACADCNRGKSDKLLDEAGRPTVGRRTVAALQERLDQASAYMELLGQLSNVTEAMYQRIVEEWARAFHARLEERDAGTVWVLDGGAWPKEATIRQFLRELDVDQILGAIDVAASRVGSTRGNDKYFYAICWRMIRDKRGAAQAPGDDLTVARDEVEWLRTQLATARTQLAEANEVIDDLRLNIRRLREDAGRS